MTTLRVVFSSEALDDLLGLEENLIEYTGSAPFAEAFVQRLKEFCDRTGMFPRSGKPIHLEGRPLRVVTFEKRYRVLYTLRNDQVFILGIHHVKRELSTAGQKVLHHLP